MRNNKALVLYCSIFITLVLAGISAGFKWYSFWGINHIAFLPHLYWYLYAILIAVSVILLAVKRFESTVEQTALSIDRLLWGSGKWPRLALAIFAMLIFYIFRVQIHLLGDGYTWLANLGRDSGYIHKWAEPVSTYLIRFIQQFLGAGTEQTALEAFRILSIFSGGIFVYNIIGIIDKLSPAPQIRLIGLFTFLFSGTTLLFFGYVEFYPVTWAAASIFINLSLTYLMERRLLILTLLAFIATILMHVEAVFLLPGVAILLTSHVEKPLLKKSCYVIIALIAVAFAGYLIWLYHTRIEFEVLILPPLQGRPVAPDYTIFSLVHLVDLVNILFLIFPGWLFIFGLVFMYGNFGKIDRMTVYLAALSSGSLLFLVIYGAAITMGRDWDIFSLALFTPGLLMIRLISNKRSEMHPRPVMAYILMTGFLTVCFLSTAILHEPYEKRFRTLLNERNDNGWALLANYYHDSGDEDKFKEIITERIKRFPQLTLLQMAYNLLDNGDYENARKIAARLVEENPYRADFHQILGNVSGKLGDFESSEEHFEIATRLKPYNSAIRNEFGRMYLDHKDYEHALVQLGKAFKMTPEVNSISESMALCYIYLKHYDSAQAMADNLFAHDTNSPGGHLIDMVILINTGDIPAARYHYSKYKEYGQNRPDYQNIIEYYRFLEN